MNNVLQKLGVKNITDLLVPVNTFIKQFTMAEGFPFNYEPKILAKNVSDGRICDCRQCMYSLPYMYTFPFTAEERRRYFQHPTSDRRKDWMEAMNKRLLMYVRGWIHREVLEELSANEDMTHIICINNHQFISYPTSKLKELRLYGFSSTMFTIADHMSEDYDDDERYLNDEDVWYTEEEDEEGNITVQAEYFNTDEYRIAYEVVMDDGKITDWAQTFSLPETIVTPKQIKTIGENISMAIKAKEKFIISV